MTAFRRIAAASVLLLGFGATAQAQTAYPSYWATYDGEPLSSGRSVYVDRAPRSNVEADQIVMGLRVPYGPRGY